MGQPGLPRLGNATPSVRQSLRCRNVNVAFCFATDCTGGLDQRKRKFAVGKLQSRRKIWRLVCSTLSGLGGPLGPGWRLPPNGAT